VDSKEFRSSVPKRKKKLKQEFQALL